MLYPELQELADDLKSSIVENIIENATDQAQSGTLFEFVRAFDLYRHKNWGILKVTNVGGSTGLQYSILEK